MLSRVALSRGAQAQKVVVRGLSVSAPAMVRGLVFPEEWFTACYSKTGVTGPYMFLVGVGTFLASKEFFVMEHDFYVGLGLAAVLTLVVKQVGPDWTATINQELDEEEAALRSIRQSEIDACKQAIDMEKESQMDAA